MCDADFQNFWILNCDFFACFYEIIDLVIYAFKKYIHLVTQPLEEV